MKNFPLPYPRRFSLIEHARMIIIICNVYTVEKWSMISPPPSRNYIYNSFSGIFFLPGVEFYIKIWKLKNREKVDFSHVAVHYGKK